MSLISDFHLEKTPFFFMFISLMWTVWDADKTEFQTYEFAYENSNSARPFLIGRSKKVLESYPEEKYGILV